MPQSLGGGSCGLLDVDFSIPGRDPRVTGSSVLSSGVEKPQERGQFLCEVVAATP